MQNNSSTLFNPSEEHSMLRAMVRDFTEKSIEPQAHQFNKDEVFNYPLFKELGTLGLLGITASEKYGGSAMGTLAAVIAHEEIAYSDPGLALAYLSHSILCVNNIEKNGSDEQKSFYLPKLCSGEWVGSMAMSEPNVGTDVFNMQTTAKKTDTGYVINGRKMWITNGVLDDSKTPSDCVFLYAITGKLPSGRPQVSAFLVNPSHKGYSVGQKILDKTGMRASNTAELVFENCHVPANALVGAEGESTLHMMKNLEIERLTLAALSVGIAKRALKIMIQYAKDREAFGRPLHDFGQIQKYIGDSFADYQAARTYLYHTAQQVDASSQVNHRIDSDGVKLIAATMGKNISDRAIQVLGGYGYTGEYIVERLWRDAKLLEIGGGTIEVHQKNISKDLSKTADCLNS